MKFLQFYIIFYSTSKKFDNDLVIMKITSNIIVELCCVSNTFNDFCVLAK